MSHIEFWFWAGLSGVLIAAASWMAVLEFKSQADPTSTACDPSEGEVGK